MRRGRARFAALFGVLAVMFGLTIAPASASSFTDIVAQRWVTSSVYVDSSAASSMSSATASALNSQIRASRKNIYLAVLNPAQVNAASSTAMLDAMHNSLGARTSEIIGIVTPAGTYAHAYNLSASLIGGTKVATDQIVANARLSGTSPSIVGPTWVNAMLKLSGWTPAGTTPIRTVAASHKTNTAMIFIVVGAALVGLAAIGLVVYLIARRKRLKRERAEAEQQQQKQEQRDRARFQERIIAFSNELDGIEVDAQLDHTAMTYYAGARANLSSAQNMLDRGDFAETARYLVLAKQNIERVQQIIDPTSAVESQYASRSGAGTASSTPRTADRPDIFSSNASGQTASTTSSNAGGVQFRHPDTQQIVVIHNNPQPTSSFAYPHWWRGGLIGGVWYDEGFYAYDVWNASAGWGDPITDMIVAEEIHEENREAYEAGMAAAYDTPAFTGGGDYDTTNVPDPVPDTIDTSPDYTGGGDYDGSSASAASDPEPTYDTPDYGGSYDTGSSDTYQQPDTDYSSYDTGGSDNSGSDYTGGGDYS